MSLKDELLKLLKEDSEFRIELAKLLVPEIARFISIPLNVATKEDIENLRKEMYKIRDELRNEMYQIRDELKGEIDKVKNDVDNLRKELARTRMDIGALTEAFLFNH